MKISTLLLSVTALLWITGVGAGFYLMMVYQMTPGANAQAPSAWPSTSLIQPSRTSSTLIMLAHPHCPCTRASVAELAKLMATRKSKVNAYVLFLSPGSMPAHWEKTDIWSAASSIPGVTVVADSDGAEARQFAARTSGHTLLYNSAGQLVFSGGITGARGHMGDNPGLTALTRAVDGGTNPQHSFVFGCSLVQAETAKSDPR